MSTQRATIAAVLSAAGLLLAGCGSSGGSTEEAPPASSSAKPEPKALASFDTCTVFKPQELESLRVTEPGKPVGEAYGGNGCDFLGEDLIATVYKAPGDDLAYWKNQRSNYVVFQPNQVNGRDGIKAVVNSAKGQGICRQIVEAGQGSVSVAVKYDSDEIQGNDPCAKALEIARMIEPRLPK